MIKDLKPIRGAHYIASLIAQGENECQDFKYAISDARKIARTLSAFANHMGGRLLVGVKDNGSIAGLRSEEDIYMVEQAAQMYCVPAQHPVYTAFRTENNETILRVELSPAEKRPVRVREHDGLRAYLRVADENIAVPELMERVWRLQSDPDRNVSVGVAEHTLLHLIGSQGTPLEPVQIARMAKLSLATTEHALVTLAVLDLINLTVSNGRLTASIST